MESWLERLPSIVGYEARDIWNCDETGLFWKALRIRVWLRKSKHAREVKNRNYE